jgi:hypothetical protein
MSYQLATAKVWDGSQWVAAAGGGAGWYPLPVTNWTSYVAVTANSTAHTKGAWTELIASTSAASDYLQVAVEGVGVGNTNTATLLDIGVGGAGSETAIVSNVAIGGAAAFALTNERSYRFNVPVYIPSGSRVSARIQSVVTGGKTAQVSIRLGAGPNPAGTSSTTTTLGTSTATSAGTSLPGSNNVWTQFIASTSAQYGALTVVPSVSNTSMTSGARSIELGRGGSGSEVTFIQTEFATSTSESVGLVYTQLAVTTVVASTRLAVRYISTATANASFCAIATETLGV